MRRVALAGLIAVVLLFPAVVWGAPLDWMPFARLTASDTRDTFLLLWPRETDDAPATVRDADPETGWKPETTGAQSITADFAPLARHAPTWASMTAEWSPAPDGPVEVVIYDYCGGTEIATFPWPAGEPELAFTDAVSGFCVVLRVENAGRATLVEWRAYTTPVDEEPAIAEVTASTDNNGLIISWAADSATLHHVEVHFVDEADATPDQTTRIDIDLTPGEWRGPLPVAAGHYAALVPVADDGSTGEPHVVEIPGRKGALLPASGVIEGFYGRPWSHQERRNMILLLARLGLGVYAYAPKNDPRHRDEWRDPYPPADLAKFLELNELGRQVGVGFSYGISPGKDIVPGNAADRQALLDKLAPFVDGGVRHFTLLFDDIEGDISQPIDGALGGEHVELANWLLAKLSARAGEDVRLWFVPTVYSTSRQHGWPGGEEYLERLIDLDDGISIMWTGTGTSSPTLSAADVDEVTELTGRPPIIWDNQHATDGGDGFWGRVYLAPYRDRSVDLVDAVEGIVANPNILGSVDRLLMATYAAYLRDPAVYDPDASQAYGAELAAETEGDAHLALQLAQTFYGYAGVTLWDEPIYPLMDAALAAFGESYTGDDLAAMSGAGGTVVNVGAQMAVVQNELHHSGLDTPLVDDFWFPTDRVRHYGYALLHTMSLAGSRLAGEPSLADNEAANKYFLLAAQDRYQLSLLGPLFFKNHIALTEGIADLGFVAPAITDPPETNLRAGETWRHRPATDAAVAVFGLPGSCIEAGEIQWTPPHAGRYVAVVTALNETGWAWREWKFVVQPAVEPADDDDNDDTTDLTDDDGDDDDDDDVGGCGC